MQLWMLESHCVFTRRVGMAWDGVARAGPCLRVSVGPWAGIQCPRWDVANLAPCWRNVLVGYHHPPSWGGLHLSGGRAAWWSVAGARRFHQLPAGAVRCHWGPLGPQDRSEPPLEPSGRPATMREPMAGGSSLSRGVLVVPPRATPGCSTSHGAGDMEQAAWQELFLQGPTPGHLLGLSPLRCRGGWSWRDPSGVHVHGVLLGVILQRC